MKRMILMATLLAACQPVPDNDVLRAGGIEMTVPPLLHPAQDVDGFILASGGWRMAWAEPEAGPGRPLLAVAGTSGSGDGRLLQGGVRIGESRDPASVANCLTFGLAAGDATTLPDRSIDGVPFTVIRNSDAGMSQRLTTTSLRAVTDGRCVAIDRYTYASPRPIPEGAPNPEDLEAELDAALASIRIR